MSDSNTHFTQAAIPWMYWAYFASQSIGVEGQADFEQNTKWVPRIYLSLIVIGNWYYSH